MLSLPQLAGTYADFTQAKWISIHAFQFPVHASVALQTQAAGRSLFQH
jgi:hypothetical protein